MLVIPSVPVKASPNAAAELKDRLDQPERLLAWDAEGAWRLSQDHAHILLLRRPVSEGLVVLIAIEVGTAPRLDGSVGRDDLVLRDGGLRR